MPSLEKEVLLSLSQRIREYYVANKRDLPWRRTKEPYIIWLSEVILQQTRVDQGLPYFIKITERFPTVLELANANEEEVLKLWQGLGYYSRARNLHAAAKQVMELHDGVFPDSYNDLIGLKGIGSYTAAAISSICSNEPIAVVDGNVYRVIARVLGIEVPIDTHKGKSTFQELAEALLDRSDPGTHNQAMMEFGATVCTPKSPSCVDCTISTDCFAFNEKRVNELPIKSKRLVRKDRYFYYFDIRINGKRILQQRGANDIWQNLYQFPLIETPTPVPNARILKLLTKEEWFPNEGLIIKNIAPVIKHQLTHQTLHISFMELRVEAGSLKPLGSGLIAVNMVELDKFPFPKPIAEYLDN